MFSRRTLLRAFGAEPVLPRRSQGISPFAINTKVNEVLADVVTGVDVINRVGGVMRVQYDGRFAQDLQQNSVSLKGSVPF